MSLIYEERLSDSPYVETVISGQTLSEGSSVRPAESHWHLVFSKHDGKVHPIVVGPLTTSGVVYWAAGAEILWIKFKPGTFIPHLPARNLLDKETLLPDATSQSFWLKGSAWQFPDFENADTFVNKLIRENVLAYDPVVNTALQDHPQDVPSRTVRHRFLQTTGLTQTQIRQIERAQRAADLLRQGKSIVDAVYEFGYYDQPHLTRAFKQWIGHTPAQLVRSTQPG